MQGRSLLPLIEGRSTGRTEVYSEYSNSNPDSPSIRLNQLLDPEGGTIT